MGGKLLLRGFLSSSPMNRKMTSRQGLSIAISIGLLAIFLVGSLWFVSRRPGFAPLAGLLDGLAVGIVLGATRLVRSYNESWDEFWETTALTYLLGILAILVY